MLEDRSIVCISQDWGGDPTSKTHIMRILARRNRVLWVNSIGMRRPRATRADLRRLLRKLGRGLGPCREAAPNLLVVDPLTVPLHGAAWVDRLNAAMLAARLRRLCRRHRLERPILWTFLPNAGGLVGRLGESLVVYHCVDEYAEFSGVPREAVLRMERDLVRRADVVIASAETLCSERLPLNPNTHFVPHGVDASHFGQALDPATRVPDDLAGLPRPIVGFFGLLGDWVDLELIREVAAARPDMSFALIGKEAADTAVLRGVPNVHRLGQKPYAALPAYCRGFDVAMIPFRINRLTLRVNPLKLREYLAAGLPVVSTRLPEVERLDGLVRVVDGAAAFSGAIDALRRDRTAASDRLRAEAVRDASWEARVQRMAAIVADSLGARSGPGERRCA